MKRLFVAIKISPDKEYLEAFRMLKAQFRHEKIKWVDEQNIHITLKFFGEMEENRIPEIDGVLRELAGETETFSFSLRNLGIFGSSYNPKVIWAGIEPYTKLSEIMKLLQDKLQVTGFEKDRQNTVPHLTLGRIKELKDKHLFQQILSQHKNIASEVLRVDRFFLYESILKKEGPVYLVLKTYILGGERVS